MSGVIDDSGGERPPISGEIHSVWDFDDPDSVTEVLKRDPSAMLQFETLKMILKANGPLRPGTITELVGHGQIKLAGLRYNVAMSFKVSPDIAVPPPTVEPPTDTYR